MAKKPKTTVPAVNLDLLKSIDNQSVTHVGKNPETEYLVTSGYIEVNTSALDGNGNAAVRLTEAGKALIMTTPAVSNPSEAEVKFPILKGIELPPSKRGAGRGGAPKQYPFDTMALNDSFFVPATAAKPDPLKSMQSTVSSANFKNSKETEETKEVSRVKRGPKNRASLDPDGNKIYENKVVKVRVALKKFTIRGIKKGDKLGTWTAEADGAIIQRTL